MPSVFSVFFKETTFSDKKYIIIISILYAILCPGLIGIAVWFKEPALVCKSIKAPDEAPFSCTQETACQADLYTYQIDYSRSSPSIATKMEIVCSKKNLKRAFLSAYFFGGVLGCLANIFVYIPAKGRKYAQSILGFAHAFANFGIMFLFLYRQFYNLQILELCFQLVMYLY